MADLELWCFLVNSTQTPNNAFPIDIAKTNSVGKLKKAIKEDKPNSVTCDAHQLTIWKVSLVLNWYLFHHILPLRV